MIAFVNISVGQVFKIKDRGNSYFEVIDAGEGELGNNLIQCTGDASLQLRLISKPSAHSDAWGLGGSPLESALLLAGNLRNSHIFGGRNNSIDMGVGATGKGDGVAIVAGNANKITALFDGDCQGAFIGGGWENWADGYWVTIVGGKGNQLNGDIVNYGFIGGGNRNKINGAQAFLSVIVGGRDNLIDGPTANRCFIGGGALNTISGTTTSRAVIVGGEENVINGNAAYYTFIGGGQRIKITGQNSGHSLIVGGKDNKISGANTECAALVGGQDNDIAAASAAHSFIGGGRGNKIENNGQYSAIISGYLNKLSGQRSVIMGGYNNYIASVSGTQNVIGGGNGNKMLSVSVQNSVIGGGYNNEIGTAGSGTNLAGVVIAGGEDNIVIASRGIVVGGLGLRADSYLEVVKGAYNDNTNPDGIGSPSKTAYVDGQIAESLGIGVNDANRANAYVWLKNGKQLRYNTPVYVDNAAALVGGELVGTVYRTPTGALMEAY